MAQPTNIQRIYKLVSKIIPLSLAMYHSMMNKLNNFNNFIYHLLISHFLGLLMLKNRKVPPKKQDQCLKGNLIE